MNKNYEKMQSMTFGVELEYEHISLDRAAAAVADAVGGTYHYEGGYYSKRTVALPDWRKWTIMTDGSLSCGCETVSPVCTLADMDMVQKVVRALRAAGARAAATCGLHVHVGAKDMTCRTAANLAKMWYMNENFMVKGCGTRAERLYHYTRQTAKPFTDELAKFGADVTWEKFAKAYYKGVSGFRGPSHHYCDARYYTLNFHNILGYAKGYEWAKPTVEFRLFEATTHAGEVRANILAAMAIVAKAETANRIQYGEGKKYEYKRNGWTTEFSYLGWTGEEMKIVRFHFLKRAVA